MSIAFVLPSSAGAALVIENNFTGTGSLTIYLEEFEEGGWIVDRIECTEAKISGTVSNPPDTKANLSSWTAKGCTAYPQGYSSSTASVTIMNLPSVEALSTSKVRLKKPGSEAFKVWLEYKVGSSLCKEQVETGSVDYNYTSGAITNQLSVSVREFFSAGELFMPAVCLDGGFATFEPNFTFPDPQFEVASIRQFLLRNENSAGSPNIVFPFGLPGDKAIAGDWNKDETDTVGVKRSSTFYLRNSNSGGSPDLTFSFGDPEDLPLAGDWNNDGTDTIGVYRPSNRTFYLRNTNSNGTADITVDFGNTGDVPIVGDWNNDGTDTIGVYRPSNTTFYLRNTNSNGIADITAVYGSSGDVPIVGDWNKDGVTTIGVNR